MLEGMDSFNSFNDPQGSGETTHSCPDTLHMLCQVFHGFSKAKEGELKDVGKIRLLMTESIRKVFRGDKSLVALLRSVCQISSSTHLFWSTLCCQSFRDAGETFNVRTPRDPVDGEKTDNSSRIDDL